MDVPNANVIYVKSLRPCHISCWYPCPQLLQLLNQWLHFDILIFKLTISFVVMQVLQKKIQLLTRVVGCNLGEGPAKLNGLLTSLHMDSPLQGLDPTLCCEVLLQILAMWYQHVSTSWNHILNTPCHHGSCLYHVMTSILLVIHLYIHFRCGINGTC
jgi:hypothetical protein